MHILYMPSKSSCTCVHVMHTAASYPWGGLTDREKKWLFLSDNVQLLNKNLLYGERQS